MELFVTLVVKVVPLYVLIFLGYLAGKKLGVRKESVSALLIYFIAPFVVFSGVIASPLDRTIVLLPLLCFILCCLIGTAFYIAGAFVWSGPERNILAFAAGTGNTGYFGLPVILALLGPQYFSLTVLAILGFILFENSLGYYFVARGHLNVRDALLKVLKLPAIYAFVAGVAVLALHVAFPATFQSLFTNFQGAYSILGMMLVGLGLAGIGAVAPDRIFLFSSLFAKFVVWPVVVVLFILADRSLLHLFSPMAYAVLLVLSIVPLAANTVAFATQLKAAPEKAAIAVMISTLIALVYIPLFMSLVYPLILK
jgi:predicted permease